MIFPKLLPFSRDEIKSDDDRWIDQHCREALEYISNFKWVVNVKKGTLEAVYPRILVLCRTVIEPIRRNIDSDIWVVSGNLPNAYFVTDCAKNVVEALEVYCQLMDDWIEAVENGGDLRNCFPVKAVASQENAHLLRQRIDYIRSEFL